MSTERFKLDPPPEYYSLSGEGFTLRVNPEVLGTLDALVREGVRALPRRGLEIGGVLLGSDASDVSLDAVHAVTVEHRFGPSYQLSDADIELSRQTISQLRQPFGPGVIGHFRSYTGGELEVTAADRTISALTGVPQPLMLLIRGSLTQPSLARLYRNSSGEFVELLQFPLVRPTAESPASRPVETPSDETASPAAYREIARRPPAAPAPVRRNSAAHLTRRNAVLVTGLLACAALVAYFLLHKPPPQSPDSARDIGLSVRRASGQLIVSWDRSSPTVRNGVSGVLTIQDGAYQRKFPLTSSELLSQTFAYTPETATVEFRLEIYRDRYRHADDRIIVFADASQSAPEHAAPEGVADRVAVDVARESPANKVNRPRAGLFRPPPRAMETRDTSKPGVPATAIPPPVISPPVQRPEILPAPEIAKLPAPVLPRRPDPAPIPAAKDSDVAQNLDVVRRVMAPPSAISYVAAIPVRKTSPTVPANLRSLIAEDISIEVKVVVDAQGEVVSATPVNAPSSGQKLLSRSAVQAAMLWRFKPARRDGQPVGSEAVLKFNFEPQAH